MADIESYDVVAANNTGLFPENQAPSTVNDGGRQGQADQKAAHNRINGDITAGGTADALTATFTPAHTAHVAGRVLVITAASANATTTPTFTLDALAAKTITKFGGQALAVGDIYGAGHELILKDAGTYYELMNPRFPIQENPSFSVHRNGTAQTNITSTDQIEWTTEDFDTNSDFDNATNFRHTPTVSGKYLYTFNLQWSSVTAGDSLNAYLYKNGSNYKGTLMVAETGAGANNQSVTAIVDMNGTTDYVEVWAQNQARDTSQILGNSAGTWFMGVKCD